MCAETTNESAGKVMVRGCKAKIAQKADTVSAVSQKQEDGPINQSCKTQEEIDLV